MLAHDVLGDPAAPVTALLLHGILGSRNNWKSFCRRAMGAAPGVRCVVADLRGHGRSHDEPPPHTVTACAQDVLALPFPPTVVIGHSFGGKVALEMARLAPERIESVVVLDAPPGRRAFGEGLEEIDRVIAAVRAVAMPVSSRKALVEDLLAAGLSEPIAQWMTTNLVPVEGAIDGAMGGATASAGGLRWTFDLDVIGALLRSFAETDLWPFLEHHSGAPRIHLVQAGRGARFTPADRARVDALAAAGRVVAHTMPNAGHWLHTDDPEGLLAILGPILRGAAS